MRIFKYLLALVTVAFFISCSTHTTFPVSNTVPAAKITVSKSQDKNKNYVIEVKADDLAEPSRLEPPKNNYSVWVVSDNGTTHNLGQLMNVDGGTSRLRTTIPHNVQEIYITAEDQGDLTYPSGVEISRLRFDETDR